jgi:hypothetical protein
MTHDFNQRPFWNTLAQLMIKSSSEETFSEANGKLYRWEARFNLDLDDGKSMSPQSLFDLIKKNVDEEKKEREKLKVSMVLPHGFRFFLQLNDGNKNSKWYDWIYLAKSDIQNAGIGVFAGRAFPKNGIVGFYVGEEIWRATEPGTEEATQEYLASIGVKEDFHCLHTRDKTGTIRLLKPKPFNSEERNHLYMGMHFLNNACFMFINGSKKYRGAMKDNNCKLVCDGSIVTVKKIEKDSELLSAYSEQEIKCASANQSPNLKRKHAPEVAINKKK